MQNKETWPYAEMKKKSLATVLFSQHEDVSHQRGQFDERVCIAYPSFFEKIFY
jgi:hypothetical protein